MNAVPRFESHSTENPDDEALERPQTCRFASGPPRGMRKLGSGPAFSHELDTGPSKTQRKQASHELQKLGESLAALSVERLAAMPMGESLRDALLQYKSTRSHEGRRRQMQFVGKLIRREPDEAVQAMQEAIAGTELFAAKASLVLHQIEAWRSELLADDEAMTPWLAAHPGADAQRLRSLVRAARKDAASEPGQRNGRAYRELFQLLKNFVDDT
jgi:ribosome-associated protein